MFNSSLHCMQIFIQTGYPLDLPSGSLGSYCIYEYHMVWYDFLYYLDLEEEEFSYVELLGPKSEEEISYFYVSTLQPCSMGFATGGKTFFLWGGCMMVSRFYIFVTTVCVSNQVIITSFDLLQMHADDFRYDRYGVVSGLRDGGYSDDMTLAAIAGNVQTTDPYQE